MTYQYIPTAGHIAASYEDSDDFGWHVIPDDITPEAMAAIPEPRWVQTMRYQLFAVGIDTENPSDIEYLVVEDGAITPWSPLLKIDRLNFGIEFWHLRIGEPTPTDEEQRKQFLNRNERRFNEWIHAMREWQSQPRESATQ